MFSVNTTLTLNNAENLVDVDSLLSGKLVLCKRPLYTICVLNVTMFHMFKSQTFVINLNKIKMKKQKHMEKIRI